MFPVQKIFAASRPLSLPLFPCSIAALNIQRANYNWLMRAQIGYLRTFLEFVPHKVEGPVDGQRHWKRPSVADITSTCGVKWPCQRCIRVNFSISMSDITLEVDHLTCAPSLPLSQSVASKFKQRYATGDSEFQVTTQAWGEMGGAKFSRSQLAKLSKRVLGF
jgi:hypothetical protein